MVEPTLVLASLSEMQGGVCADSRELSRHAARRERWIMVGEVGPRRWALERGEAQKTETAGSCPGAPTAGAGSFPRAADPPCRPEQPHRAPTRSSISGA